MSALPVPTIVSFDEFNESLWEWCEKDARRPHYKKKLLIEELWEDDKVSLLCLPEYPFSVFRYAALTVSKSGFVTIDERELELHRAVKIVEKIAPRIENRGLVIILVELIVDILKLDGFGVIGVRHPANTVWEHPLKRDAVLCRLMLFVGAVRFRYGRLDLTPVGSCELFCR